MRVFAVVFFVCINVAYPIHSLDDIAVGATYRMNLTTGDMLEGTIDSKTDTSVIIDCKGNAYTFNAGLISDFALLAPPPLKTQQKQSTAFSESEVVSYETLIQRNPIGSLLEISIKTGILFRGKLASIDNDNVKLDIDGSLIPISRTVVDKIAIGNISAKPQSPDTAISQTKTEALDTVIVKNTETDENGNPRPDKLIVGKILQDDKPGITILTNGTTATSYTFDQVVRVFRHSLEDGEEDQIKRYAKPLFCPQGMILVDLPPGKANRPYFKVCIDKYEFPNKEGALPQVNVSFSDAKTLCEKQGKRLCSADEWRWSCSGLEGYIYPYGRVLEKEDCNMESAIETSGNRNKCISKFGVVDMVGNVFEWVRDKGEFAAAMGGPLSKCQNVSPGAGGDPKPSIGFRCCKSN